MFEWVGRGIAGYLSKPIGKPGGRHADARLVAEDGAVTYVGAWPVAG